MVTIIWLAVVALVGFVSYQAGAQNGYDEGFTLARKLGSPVQNVMSGSKSPDTAPKKVGVKVTVKKAKSGKK